jgi:hypothetical protein
MEEWSTGVMEKWITSVFQFNLKCILCETEANTPIHQYSIAPGRSKSGSS